MKNREITQEYVEKIRPLLPMAQKAYGAKTQNTPAHQASREYTELLVKFVADGGSLIDLANSLGVAYSGLRRRVITAKTPAMSSGHVRRKYDPSEIDAAIERVRRARENGSSEYHAQLAIEYYENGISLSQIAKGLGISNAAPLYYGVQRHAQRNTTSA